MSGGEVSWMWGVAFIAFAFGAGLGAGLVMLLGSRYGRARKLETDLDTMRTRFAEYRREVDLHFRKSANLFQGMTDQYRAVYRHLATGAQTLCSDSKLPPALDLPEANRLTQTGRVEDHELNDADSEVDAYAEVEDGIDFDVDAADDVDHHLGDAPQVPDFDPDTASPERIGDQAVPPSNRRRS